MELFESFGIDPAEAQANLSLDELNRLNELLAQKAIATQNDTLAAEIAAMHDPNTPISQAGSGFQGGGFSGRGGTGLQMAADPSFAAMLPQDMSSIQPPMTPAMDFGAGEGFQGHGFEGDNIARIHAMSADPGWAAQDVVLGSQGMSPATLPTVAPENYGELSLPSDADYSQVINPQSDPVPTGGIYNRRDAGAAGFGPGSVTPEGMPGSLVHPSLSLADRVTRAEEAITDKQERLSTWDPVGAMEEGRIMSAGTILRPLATLERTAYNAIAAITPDDSMVNTWAKSGSAEVNDRLRIWANLEKIWHEYGGSGIDPKGGWGILDNKTIESAFHSLPITGLTAGTSMVAGLPVGLAGMFAMVYADSYGSLTAKGVDPLLAAEEGAVMGLTEVITEIPFLKFLKGATGPVKKALTKRIRELIAAGGYEGAGEAVNSIMQNTWKMLRRGEKLTAEQFLSEAWDSFKAGVLMGGGIKAGVDIATGATNLAGDIKVARDQDIGIREAGEQRSTVATPEAIAAEAVRQARSDGGFNERRIDTNLEQKLNAERELAALETGVAPEASALEEARIDRSQGTVSFNPNDIREHLVNTFGEGVTQRQANEHLTGLLAHEAVAHGGLLKFFQTAGKGSPLEGAVGNLTDYMAKFRETNAKKIDAWLETPRGQLYADRDAQTQTEEYVAIQLAEGMTDGPMRGVLSKIKLMLTKATGFKYSEGEVIALMRNIRRQLKAGTMTQGPVKGAIAPTTPEGAKSCLLYTSPSPRDQRGSGMPAWG